MCACLCARKPFSEPLVVVHTARYENPLKFSGKELDDITGLYDHGARSRNPISTLWYGVDPLWEKYPDFSPYNYCAGNPVKLVDEDGRDAQLTIDEDNHTIKIEANIILKGKGATQKKPETMKQDIMNTWGSIKEYSYGGVTYKLDWQIDVRLKKDGEKEDKNGINNYILVANIPVSGTKMNEGTWRGYSTYYNTFCSADDPAPHEFGHLLGLRDRYLTHFQKEAGWGEYGTVLGNWQGNIMAQSAGFGKVEKRNLDVLFSEPLFQSHLDRAKIDYLNYKQTGMRGITSNAGKFIYSINANHREPEIKR